MVESEQRMRKGGDTPSGGRPAPRHAVLSLYVQPRASRTEVVGRYGDAIKIRVAAAPEDGAANEVLVRFLAEHLSVPRSALTLRSGAGARRKRVVVNGLDTAEAVRRLTDS
jgi:uncharacterized protein (TIGR00251 family)